MAYDTQRDVWQGWPAEETVTGREWLAATLQRNEVEACLWQDAGVLATIPMYPSYAGNRGNSQSRQMVGEAQQESCQFGARCTGCPECALYSFGRLETAVFQALPSDVDSCRLEAHEMLWGALPSGVKGRAACSSLCQPCDEGLEQHHDSECFSIGTMGHPITCGAPCKYNGKRRGCKDGERCSFCHMCRWTRQRGADKARTAAASANQELEDGSRFSL
eukprot:gb/GFBE01038659.1/.p1 GENE.gb/GFBE01038659.1/~~gb/GFBE01038659.1/.p1  ORF type:complete len:219 (+),score=14.70 gb/GFBE01038659.1/:1-657(+)